MEVSSDSEQEEPEIQDMKRTFGKKEHIETSIYNHI